MNKEIWKIIFLESKETEDYYSLFYSGIKLSILRNNHYFIPQGIAINLTSYFNALPIKKWKLYTCVKNFYLKIFVKGDFQLNIIGYSFNSATLKKTIIYSNNYINSNSFFNIELQDMMDVELIGFEIISHSNCEFIDASYYADFDESNIKPIVLGLVTVTYKKEEYILRNIKIIKDELLGEISDIRENFYIHVIDNY